MIESIVVKYLDPKYPRNKRLVVPEFGAFIRKDGGETVFVEFLKKDDGVLASLVKAELGLRETEAKEAISEYVSTIKRVISTEGRYVIDGLGILRNNANGICELDYDPQVRLAQQPVKAQKQPEEPAGPVFVVENKGGGSAPAYDNETREPVSTRPPVPGQGRREMPPELMVVDAATGEPASTVSDISDTRGLHAEDKTIELGYREVPPVQERRTIADQYAQKRETAQRSLTDEIYGTGSPQQQAQAFKPAEDRTEPPRQPHNAPVDYRRQKKSKVDLVMIIAIAAAVIAIISMIFGMTTKREVNIVPTRPDVENVQNADQGEGQTPTQMEGDITE